MKAFLITLVCITTFFCGYSQEDAIIPLPEQGIFDEDDDKIFYYKDIDGDLNKFLGTWVYTDSDKELIITFYLDTHVETGGGARFEDMIYAKFKYTENSTVIYDYLNDSNAKYFTGSSLYNSRPNEIGLYYDEPTTIAYSDNYPIGPALDLEYLPCNNLGCDQLKWSIDYKLPNPTATWPFRIPTDLVLTRQ